MKIQESWDCQKVSKRTLKRVIEGRGKVVLLFQELLNHQRLELSPGGQKILKKRSKQ